MFDVSIGNRTAVFTATDYTTNAVTKRLGDLEYDPDYKTFFRFLMNNGASAITAQLVAVAAATEKSSYYCELAATTDSLQTFAGVRVTGATSLAQNEYGWFQVGGQAVFTHSGGQATAANEDICTSASVAGKVEGCATGPATAASQVGAFATAEAAVTLLDADVKASIWKSMYGA